MWLSNQVCVCQCVCACVCVCVISLVPITWLGSFLWSPSHGWGHISGPHHMAGVISLVPITAHGWGHILGSHHMAGVMSLVPITWLGSYLWSPLITGYKHSLLHCGHSTLPSTGTDVSLKHTQKHIFLTSPQTYDVGGEVQVRWCGGDMNH